MDTARRLSVSRVGAMGIFVAAACGPSSIAPGPTVDAGPRPGNVADAEARIGAEPSSCSPLIGRRCGSGQTCCVSGISGVCVPDGMCRFPIEVSCDSKSSCTGGVCCGGYMPGGRLSLRCTASCSAPDFELCGGPQDCPSGEICSGAAGGHGIGVLKVCVPEDAGTAPPEPSPESGLASD